MLKPARYALSDLPGPQIKGFPLNALVRGLERWPYLRSLILSQNNIQQLRNATYTETPLLLPLPPPASADRNSKSPRNFFKNGTIELGQGLAQLKLGERYQFLGQKDAGTVLRLLEQSSGL